MRGLIARYIKDHLCSHAEPVRKGTHRGDRIGMKKDKERAALLSSLTCRTPKAIALEVGVSYGLLRKWKTEDRFKDVMNSALTRFVLHFENHFVQALHEYEKGILPWAEVTSDAEEAMETMSREALRAVIARASAQNSPGLFAHLLRESLSAGPVMKTIGDREWMEMFVTLAKLPSPTPLSGSQNTEVRKHLNALTLEARLLLKAAEDPSFTMSSLDVTALAGLIIDRAAAIRAALNETKGVENEG